MSYSRTIINGRLTAEPEIKTFSDGTEYCNFTVAVQRSYKGKDGQRTSDFFNCKTTRGGAALLKTYFHKGDGIMVEGTMESRKYEKDGQSKIIWELNVSAINFLDGKKTSSDSYDSDAPAPTEPVMTEVETDGELPF